MTESNNESPECPPCEGQPVLVEETTTTTRKVFHPNGLVPAAVVSSSEPAAPPEPRQVTDAVPAGDGGLGDAVECACDPSGDDK